MNFPRIRYFLHTGKIYVGGEFIRDKLLVILEMDYEYWV